MSQSQFFKNARVYRLTDGAAELFAAHDLAEHLAKFRFTGGTNLEMQSLGWTPPYDGDDALTRRVGDAVLMTLRASKKLLPSSVVNELAKARAAEIEEQQGYKPGRKQMKEIKERATDDLLPKAFSVSRDTRVLFDLARGFLVIDTASSAKADEVIGWLAKTFDPFPLENLYVTTSPAQAMTGWLAADEAPANFSIDQDTELRASGESGAAIRYVKHSIDADDVRRHIGSGKQCTRLALTWADRISFVLDEGLNIKGIAPLDVLKEGEGSGIDKNDDERRDSDLALFAGEFGKLMVELIDGLGGEKDLSGMGSQPTA